MGVRNAGKTIREARIKAGLTQEQLSEGVCSVLSLSRIENGSAGVSPVTFQALMAHAGAPCEVYPIFASRTDFDSKLYQALADTIMRANWQELKEERKMCEALRELFADDLRESKEEGIMEGRNVGKLEGKLEGAASKVIEIVIKKYKKGCSVKETADMLEEPQTLIKQIYDVIGQCAPDYNVEAIYKILLDKTI